VVERSSHMDVGVGVHTNGAHLARGPYDGTRVRTLLLSPPVPPLGWPADGGAVRTACAERARFELRRWSARADLGVGAWTDRLVTERPGRLSYEALVDLAAVITALRGRSGKDA